MKIGVRKPNIKKRIKARTTGKIKRKVKKATNPFYGKKGMGMIKNPKKSIYNKVYNKTTVSVDSLFKTGSKGSSKKSTNKSITTTASKKRNNIGKAEQSFEDIISKIPGICIIAIILGVLCLFSDLFMGSMLIIGGVLILFIGSKIAKKSSGKNEVDIQDTSVEPDNDWQEKDLGESEKQTVEGEVIGEKTENLQNENYHSEKP